MKRLFVFGVLISMLIPSQVWAGPLLRWSGVASTPDCNIVGYRVYYDTEPGRYNNVIDVGDTTTMEITPLLADDTTFHFAVSAYSDANVEGPLSEPISYLRPSVPEVEDVEGFNDGSRVVVTWTADPGTAYRVYYGVNPGQFLWQYDTGVGESSNDSMSFLAAYTLYAKVVAVINGKESLTAVEVRIDPYTGPGEVQDVQADNDGETITVTWTAEAGYSYRVYYGTVSGELDSYVQCEVGEGEVQLPAELVGEAVIFKVVPVDNGEEGLIAYEMTVNPYLGVRNVQAYDTGASIIVSWDLKAGATGYIVRRAFFDDMSWEAEVYRADPDESSVSLPRFPYNNTYYRVTALDSSGSEIEEYSIFTVEPFNPEAEIRKNASGNLYASWSGQEGVDHYLIYYSLFPGSYPYAPMQKGHPDVTQELNPGFNYYGGYLYILIEAITPSGEVRWEVETSAIPSGIAPD